MAKAKEIEATETTDIETILDTRSVEGFTPGKRQDAIEMASSLTQLAQQLGTEAVDWSVIEPSFDVVGKAQFEGVPIVIGAWRMNESTKYMTKDEDNPNVLNPVRFMSLLVAAIDEETGDFLSPWCVVNDGSTGIFKQLVKYAKRIDVDADVSRTRYNEIASRLPHIIASKGFRPSEYDVETETGVTTATTWYIG